jgi:cytochrome P450
VKPALPLLGHALWFWRDTNGFLQRLARDQGDVARFRLGRREAFLLSHPDHVRRVLVEDAEEFRKGHLMRRARRLLGDGLLTSEGAPHRAQRRAMQPLFARGRLATYGAIVPSLAAAAAADWSDGGIVDVGATMSRLILEIVVRTLLGADPAPMEDHFRILSARGPMLALPLAHLLERLRVPPFAAAGRAADRLRDAMCHHVRAAAPLNDPDQAITVFLAGHDTTAAALTWAWYLLATHPDVMTRLRRELDAVCRGRDPAPDDCARLTYTSMILEETLRLFPPIGRIGRRPLREYTVAGHHISPGSAVFLSPFVTQRDPRWWPEPESFDPERWTEDAIGSRPRFAAFPFGAGPRSCVGGAMARMIGVLVIATIARRWTLHPVTSVAPRIRPILTLKPAEGLRLRAVSAA